MKTCNHAFLIDDDPITNMINTKIIRNSKLSENVIAMTDAKAALAKLEELWASEPASFPEILFLDINMPGMDGWEFLQVFIKFPEAALKQCKVVMLTSSIDLFDIKKSKSYAVVQDYIIKPLQVKMLDTLASPKHSYFCISQSMLQEI